MLATTGYEKANLTAADEDNYDEEFQNMIATHATSIEPDEETDSLVSDKTAIAQPVVKPPHTAGPSVRAQVLSFVALVIIQGAHIVFFKISQSNGRYEYNTASAVAVTEAIKFLLSLSLHVRGRGNEPLIPEIDTRALMGSTMLALCYTINNQLTFWLLLLVGPGQLSLGKSFSPMLVAMLLWVVFDQQLNQAQWISIVLVVAGLVNVLYDPCEAGDAATEAATSMLGPQLLFISCVITAFTSVFNEKLVQTKHLSLHVVNMMLYSLGFFFNIVAYMLGFTPSKVDGFFTGYDTPGVWGVLLSQSMMGLAIAFVYKYGGAIVKTFANAAQAAILTILDSIFFGIALNATRASGAVCVCASSYMYFTVALKMPKPETSIYSAGAESSVGVKGAIVKLVRLVLMALVVGSTAICLAMVISGLNDLEKNSGRVHHMNATRMLLVSLDN